MLVRNDRAGGLALKLWIYTAAMLALAAPCLAQTPIDYGAGYKMVMVQQHQQHPLGRSANAQFGSTIKLDRTYPLIASPPTPDTHAFNAEMQRRVAQWWAAMDAPEDNSTAADPTTNYALNCEPVGPAAARQFSLA